MTPAGIEPATFRFVAQHLNHCATAVPPQKIIYSRISRDSEEKNETSKFIFFLYFSDRASQYIYLNINQLDALNSIMSLFHASTCFEHKCLSSGGQNCILQPLVSHLCTGWPPINVMIPETV